MVVWRIRLEKEIKGHRGRRRSKENMGSRGSRGYRRNRGVAVMRSI